MSNHGGSYLLNGVLKMLDEASVFDFLGKEKTQRLVLDILKMGYDDDCRSAGILDDIGQRVGICCYCGQPDEELHDGVCKVCDD